MSNADEIAGHLAYKLYTDDRVSVMDALCALLVDGGGLEQVLEADRRILMGDHDRCDTPFREAEVDAIVKTNGFIVIGK